MVRTAHLCLLALLVGCGSATPEAEEPTTANDEPVACVEDTPSATPSRSAEAELRELLGFLDHETNDASIARVRGARYADRDVEQARLDCLETIVALREERDPTDPGVRCRARMSMLLQIYPEVRPNGALAVGSTPPPPPADFAPSGAPQSLTGELTDDDRRVPDDDSPYDEYPVDLQAGWTITVDMRSTAFDTYLWLIGPRRNSFVQDDDGGEGTNSHFSFTTTEAGRYIVRANSYDGTGRGPYELEIRVGQ